MPVLNQDSIFSTPSQDTITRKDLRPTVIRYEGKPIPQHPHNEGWIFGVIFLLFILFVFSINRSHNWIVDSLKNITKVRLRNSLFSKATIEESRSRFLLILFSAGVINLYIYLYLSVSTPKLSVYLVLLLCSLLFLFLKHVITRLIAFTFLNYESFKSGYENFYKIFSFLGFLIFPLLILKIYAYNGMNIILFDIFAVIFTVSAFIFITIKLFQIFYSKLLDFFHLMLYLCTLEILPLIGMYYAYKWIITVF